MWSAVPLWGTAAGAASADGGWGVEGMQGKDRGAVGSTEKEYLQKRERKSRMHNGNWKRDDDYN